MRLPPSSPGTSRPSSKGKGKSTRPLPTLANPTEGEISFKKASKAPIHLSRYGPSSLSAGALDNFRLRLGNTLGYSLEIPNGRERPLTPRENGRTFWLAQLKAGLRFPIPSFFAQLSRLYKIPLNQLTPTSIRKAVFFHMIFSLEGVEDTATFFYRSHELKHRGYYLYFSPLILFASFYGHYDSLDSG